MKSRKRRNTRRLVSRIVFILIVLTIFYFLVKPLAKVDYRLANLKIESAQLDRRIIKLQQDLNKARADLSSFSTGSGIERIAREKLNMIYPGEILYTCRDSQGGQDYLIFDDTTHPLASGYKTKSPFAKAWDIILSLFR